jgi:phospholipid/cholesterol/gamma-HCH transport system substrate-binding protein
MATKTVNNIKLGVFVIAGLLLLVLALYMIGKDTNLFSRNFRLRARFENVQGLTTGNNVRYAGIQVGTIKRVKILEDTLIEVTMLIEEKMMPYIHKNDLAGISTDGLMGNKLINIIPAKDRSPLVEDNDILPAKAVTNTDAILETLGSTNDNINRISRDLGLTVERINNSKALWSLLDDESLPQNLRASLINTRKATANANELLSGIQTLVADIKNGQGSIGKILTDTSIAYNLEQAILKIQTVGDNANALAGELSSITKSVKQDVNNGKGAVNVLLKDSLLSQKLNKSVSNIEEGTASFNESMEALKHNFLLRGYFRKQEKKRKKDAVALQ